MTASSEARCQGNIPGTTQPLSQTIAPGGGGPLAKQPGMPSGAPGLATPLPGGGGGGGSVGAAAPAATQPAQQPTDPGAAAVAPPSQGSPPATGAPPASLTTLNPDMIKRYSEPVQAINPATGKVETISVGQQMQNHWVTAADPNTRYGADTTGRIVLAKLRTTPPPGSTFSVPAAPQGQRSPADENLSRIARCPRRGPTWTRTRLVACGP